MIGLILGITVLTPILKLPPIAASLIEVAFEGGHGQSAGMADTFNELGFPQAADLSLTLATVGLVSGITHRYVVDRLGKTHWTNSSAKSR